MTLRLTSLIRKTIKFKSFKKRKTMKFKYLTLLIINSFLFLIACQNQPEKTPEKKEIKISNKVETLELLNSITDKEKDEGWQLLFDGRSFDHWKGYNLEGLPKEGWTAEEGVIVGHGGGDLITKDQYENFDLKLEFQLTKAANSGIFYLVQELEGKPIYHSAPEYQLLDNATYIETQGMDIMNKHLTGDNYDIHDGIINPAITHSKWYGARIVVNNGHVEHWLNGKKHVEYALNSPEWTALITNSKFGEWEYAKTTNGHIGLQDHGNEVRFRNIKIKKL